MERDDNLFLQHVAQTLHGFLRFTPAINHTRSRTGDTLGEKTKDVRYYQHWSHIVTY